MARKPHLCFVGWADHVHLERWAGYFARAGFPVSVISWSGRGNYPDGVRQYTIGLKGRGPRWTELKLRYLLLRIRPSIVHVHWTHFTPPVRSAWKGPLVVTAWGSDVYRRDRFGDSEWQSMRVAVAASDLVTCDSEDLAETIGSELGVDRARIRVVQWGVDTDLFSPTGPDLRTELGLGDHEVVFSARSFIPLYNQETIVEAFARLVKIRPRAFLLMKRYGGDPAYVEAIRAQIGRLGLSGQYRIIDSVPYEQMPSLYRSADVTVSIPHSDATPMALLEAMATESIPVVSDLPSLREWIDNTRNGFLVPVTDVDAVCDAIAKALDIPNGAPSRQACRELVVERASQRTHMTRMAAHYDQLADRAVGKQRRRESVGEPME